jgi:hypothetical protein
MNYCAGCGVLLRQHEDVRARAAFDSMLARFNCKRG